VRDKVMPRPRLGGPSVQHRQLFRGLCEIELRPVCSIRFKPESVVQDSDFRFQGRCGPQGCSIPSVAINIVKEGEIEPWASTSSDLPLPQYEVEQQYQRDLGYAAFQADISLEGEDIQNQFLVFAGAALLFGGQPRITNLVYFRPCLAL